MYVLIVEDDNSQYDFIKEALQEMKFVTRNEWMRTESEFNERLEEVAADKPDVIVMDIMLRWTDPAPEMKPPPPEVIRDKFYRAGFRCVKKLGANPRTGDIPIIVYSVLEVPEDLPQRAGVRFLSKNFDAKELERELLRSVKR